jgi:hypothetical protein
LPMWTRAGYRGNEPRERHGTSTAAPCNRPARRSDSASFARSKG